MQINSSSITANLKVQSSVGQWGSFVITKDS